MNFRDLFDHLSPATLQGRYGSAFMGVLGLMFDCIAQGATEAVRAPWLAEDTSPDDCLALKGTEYLMPRYPGESAVAYRARLLAVWCTWPFAGSDQAIVEQLTAAGFPSAKIALYNHRPGPNGAYPYWSQFWVVWTTPSVRVSGSWGPFVSDGSGIVTTNDQDADLIRAIVKKWKPADWICRGLAVEVVPPAALWNNFLWNNGAEWGGPIELEF